MLEIGERLKQQAQVEKNIERSKQYNLKVERPEDIETGKKALAIKKARLFNDEDYL